MVMRTRSQTLRSANRAPQSPLVAANDQATTLLATRARQRQERAARYAARVARAEARAQAAALPSSPSPPPSLPAAIPSPPPQESALPPPHIRRPLVTICDNGLSPPSHQIRPPFPVFTGRENAPPSTSTHSRSFHRNRSPTDRVVGPYHLSRLR